MIQRLAGTTIETLAPVVGEHPGEWLTLARRCPTLAAVLRASTGASADWHHWADGFRQRPPWDRVLELLRSPIRPLPALRVHRALWSQCIAAHTGWTTLESGFWTGLLADEFDVDDPITRCAALADALVDPDRPIGTLATWQNHWPLLRLDELLLEQTSIAQETPIAWSDDFAQTLRTQAELLGLRQQLRRRDLLLTMQQSTDDEALLQAVGHWLRDVVGPPAAVWIPVGGVELDLAGQAFTCNGLLGDFETQLASALRGSFHLMSQGRSVGAVYVRPQTLATIDPNSWQPLADVIGQWLERQQLRHQVAKLAAANRQQRLDREELSATWMTRLLKEFSAGAAHEINNPLAAIRGRAGKLLTSEVDPQRRQMLHTIIKQCDRIHGMINDLHEVGQDRPASTDCVRLDEVIVAAAQQAGRRRPVGNVELDDLPTDVCVMGSKTELSRTIAELILNGVQAAGRHGEVQVRLRSDAQWAYVEVADSGPGFTPHDRTHALLPFYSGRQAGRGLGMGLTIAAIAAHRHHGRLIIEPGKPTRVVLAMPINRSIG